MYLIIIIIILFVFAISITILDKVNFLKTNNRIKQQIVNNKCDHEGNEEKEKGIGCKFSWFESS
jgi:uncharacterized protein YxeA